MSLRHSTTGATAIGLCLLWLAAPSAAVTQIPQPLTLGAALSWAGEYNPGVRAARLRIQRLGGEATRADVAVPSNPRIEIEAGERDQRSGMRTDIGIRVSQEFWIAGQGGLREDAAGNRLEAARADYGYLEAATAARTRAAFLSVLVAEQAVATAQKVVATNTQLSDYASKRLDAGAGTRIESNAARLGLQRARAPRPVSGCSAPARWLPQPVMRRHRHGFASRICSRSIRPAGWPSKATWLFAAWTCPTRTHCCRALSSDALICRPRPHV
ncbi:outer membrane efflux protein [Salinisphaera dokdonensis CL-ES53]|uniref:Outer membrane efflux protein n=1 Tax=Salinisphaera dokdonensis CL-ES53 TaxID=1304272 RepID=A0ABV2B422_9GAMM